MWCVSTHILVFFFFFKQKTAYEITYGDWSSDVCSSDLSHEGCVRPSPARSVCAFSSSEAAANQRSAIRYWTPANGWMSSLRPAPPPHVVTREQSDCQRRPGGRWYSALKPAPESFASILSRRLDALASEKAGTPSSIRRRELRSSRSRCPLDWLPRKTGRTNEPLRRWNCTPPSAGSSTRSSE